MGAGAVLHGTGTPAIDRLGGLLKKMNFTGIAFFIGSMAICALPPFNGFVSEFLIYRGAFDGSFLEGSDFLFAVLAIVSLAVIGGLALACFTNAAGIVFLGEPRTQDAEKAHECGQLMRFSMALLALTCLAIGLFPEIVVMPLAVMTSTLLTLAEIPTAYLLDFCRNISLGAAVFLGLILLVFIFRKYLYRGKEPTRGPTWGCGFTRATPRIQYTATSFAAPVLEFFQLAAPLKEEGNPVAGIFPASAAYSSTADDRAENAAVNAIALPVLRVLRRLRWIQHGNIQLYIFYIVIAIAMAILLVFFM
jgi:hydrogenase-4 component B